MNQYLKNGILLNNLDKVIKKLKDLNGQVAELPLKKISNYCRDNKDETNAMLYYNIENYLWDIKGLLPRPLRSQESEIIFNKYIQKLIDCLESKNWQECFNQLILNLKVV
ncbi:MAG: hypothetical protein HeimC3_26220 [Candidatus Heimdallarchaeota archaeon LC_3]|nr:MAG: hypothetical protein HeimC3_26220 [Candidatus Heimdallarchaeota archaeon LC_3]